MVDDEKTKTEEDKKVEAAFQAPDAEQQPPAVVKQSFVADPKEKDKEKKGTPTMGEVLMYIGKQAHDTNGKLDTLIGKMDTFIELLKRPVQIPSQVVNNATAQSPLIPQIQAQASADPKLEKIKLALAEFSSLLEFDSASSNMVYLIRAKQFLGSENFAKIASIVRGLGGSYVSQGKQSHFEVSKAT